MAKNERDVARGGRVPIDGVGGIETNCVAGSWFDKVVGSNSGGQNGSDECSEGTHLVEIERVD